MEIAQILENRPKFERVFLYRALQKRRTPLPTTLNLFFEIAIFRHKTTILTNLKSIVSKGLKPIRDKTIIKVHL